MKTSVWLGVVVLGILCLPLHAETLYWSGDGTTQGGAGTWNTTAARWGTSASGPFDIVWTNANVDSAVFGGTAGAVAIGTGGITVNKISTTLGGYSFTGTPVLTFSGTDAGVDAPIGTTTLSCVYTGSLLTKTGAGRLSLNNANNTLAKYLVKGGHISTPAVNRFGTAPASLVPDYLAFDGGGWGIDTGSQDLGANRGVTLHAGGGTFSSTALTITMTLSAPVTGVGGLTVGPLPVTHTAGTILILSNPANNYQGSTTVTLGTLRLGASGVIPDGSTITLNGGTLDLNGFDETVGTVIVNSSSSTIIPTTGTPVLTASAYDLRASGTISAILGGSGTIATKTTSGTVTLTAANTFDGGFVHNGGTVRVNNPAALGGAGSPVSLANGVTLSTSAGTGRNLNYAWTINGNFSLGQTSGGTAAVTMSGSMDLNDGTRTITIINATDTITAVITNGGIAKSGSGILVINNAANAYAGGTRIDEGILAINGTTMLGSGPIIFNGGTLRTTATRDAVNTMPNALDIVVDAIIEGNTTTGTRLARFAGPVIDSGGKLIIQNSGTANYDVVLSGGDYTFTREVVLEDVNGTNVTQLSIFNLNTEAAVTYSGVISGNGSLRRSASLAGTGGTLILSGENTYTGGTALNEGTLRVSNISGSATGPGDVVIISGGRLSGGGSVAGLVSVGGTIAPGESIGTLTTGPESWNTGGRYEWEVNNTAGTQGVNWDLLSVNGGIDLQATSSGKFVIGVVSLDDASAGEIANFDKDTTYTWPIATLLDSITNFDAGAFAFDTLSFSNDTAGGAFRVEEGSGVVNLSYVPNQAPAVTGVASFARPKDIGIKIKIADLLAAFSSDPDGDGRVLVSAGPSSTNGLNNVTSDDTFIHYSPGADGNVTDSFTYTIRDDRDYRPWDTVRTASGTVVITVSPDSGGTNQTVVAVTPLPDNNVSITFAGIPGREYVVEATDSVTPPITWTPISTNIAGPNGLWTVDDLDSTNHVNRFYRTVAP